MFELKPLPAAVHRALSTAAIAATVIAPNVGQAQDNPVESVAKGVGSIIRGVLTVPGKIVKGVLGGGNEEMEEVIITGSRIASDPNLTTSSPVTLIKAEELTNRGITRVEDLLNDLPSITPENTSNEANGATGTATIDLRGLSSARTLVLTNGHRMGFGDVFTLAPDVNQIPAGLVDRIDVLTGGASSTYGSDAMSGVVNFVMKTDFEGLEVNYQFSGYSHSRKDGNVRSDVDNSGFTQSPNSVFDGDTNDLTVIMGANSSDGKGNITAYMGYRNINAVTQSERDFSSCALSSRSGTGCAGSATLPTGLFTPFDGTDYFTVSGDQFVPWDYTYYNYGPLNHFQRPDERFTAGMFGHYEVNEHFEAYTEFTFMDDHTDAQIAPSGAFFVTSTLNCSNAFLSAQQFGAIGCTAPTDVLPLYIGRRNVEGGPRDDDLRHTSWRLLGGLRGDITDDWSYDAFINVSRTTRNQEYRRDLSTTRIIRALDAVTDPATGQITCASVINGSDPSCVPWNVFQTGGATQAAIDYITLPLFSTAELEQDQYVAYVTGDLTPMGIVSPMAEDGVQIVLGGEYRDESMVFEPDLGFTTGDGAGQGGPIPAVNGGIQVTEFFVEGHIPLVQNQPMIESLSADLGYRYSDYDNGQSTDTYKILGEYSPYPGVKFRGGYNRASRTANIRELFAPSSLGLWSGTDPCSGATPTQTLAQCALSGVTAAQYGSIPASPAGQYNGFFGGNTALTPETSNSFTGGIVLIPDQVPGLQVSVDYWSIEIKDAISNLDPQTAVNQCGLTGDPTFCSLVQRSPVNGNLWIGSSASAPRVLATNVNIAFFKTSGVDFAASYDFDMGNYGDVFTSFRGTWLQKFDQQQSIVASVDNCEGKYAGACGRARPEWRHTVTTTWTTPWDVTGVLSWRYIKGVDEFDLDRFSSSAENYIDLTLSYSPRFLDVGETTITVGASNLLDNNPPVSGFFGNVSGFGNGNTIPGLWDTLGRYIFVGVNQKF